MRCYCVENEETFDFCVEGVTEHDSENVEAAWFKRDGDRYVKRYPSWIEDQEILARNFALLGPSMFKKIGTWEESLEVFAQICEAEGIRWAITGSVSETVLGVEVIPHDLDIVVHTEDFFKIKKIFIDHMVEPFIDNGGTWVVRYFGRISLRGMMLDIVADDNRNMETHTYDQVSWRTYQLLVEPLLDRLIIELHRNRHDRITVFKNHLKSNEENTTAIGLLETVQYLQSEEALNSIDKDPYWPKWDSPWWHMSVLFEMGLSDLIPEKVIDRMILRMNERYLKFFPIHEHELPEGIDYYTRIPCHCQLGNMYQILRSHRADIDMHMPWIRPWFIKYQLPDGGLNCEDDAYRESLKSSIASSLPVFEAMMMVAEAGELSSEEEQFMAKGIKYLIEHGLVYKTSGGLMDEDFLKLQFPRFYSYDILRGLSLLARWYHHFKDSNQKLSSLALDTILEGIKTVTALKVNGHLTVMRSDLFKGNTRAVDGNGEFTIIKPKSYFSLLEAVGNVGEPSHYLNWLFDEACRIMV
jgi:hypothetical protein